MAFPARASALLYGELETPNIETSHPVRQLRRYIQLTKNNKKAQLQPVRQQRRHYTLQKAIVSAFFQHRRYIEN